MKTKAELFAAAEAFEEVIEFYRAEGGGAEHFAYAIMDEWEPRAIELRAQAAQVKEQEPVAWLNNKYGTLHLHGQGEVTQYEAYKCGELVPLYAHPPAPTEHTAADAPNREAGNLQALKAAKEPSAVGVPDVDGLVNWLLGNANLMGNEFDEKLIEAAKALAALQSQLANANERARVSEVLFQDMNAENAQQSERIKEMEAKLAEALGLLTEASGRLSASAYGEYIGEPRALATRIKDFLKRTKSS